MSSCWKGGGVNWVRSYWPDPAPYSGETDSVGDAYLGMTPATWLWCSTYAMPASILHPAVYVLRSHSRPVGSNVQDKDNVDDEEKKKVNMHHNSYCGSVFIKLDFPLPVMAAEIYLPFYWTFLVLIVQVRFSCYKVKHVLNVLLFILFVTEESIGWFKTDSVTGVPGGIFRSHNLQQVFQ